MMSRRGVRIFASITLLAGAAVAQEVPSPSPAPAGVTINMPPGFNVNHLGAGVASPKAEPQSSTYESRPVVTSGKMSEYRKFRDPFQEIVDQDEAKEKKTELELFETSEFRLTGVISGPLRMRAILVSPKDQSYIVNEGMKIGQRGGRIKKITTRSVVVEEKLPNEIGEIERIESEISLASPEAGR